MANLLVQARIGEARGASGNQGQAHMSTTQTNSEKTSCQGRGDLGFR